MKRIALLVSGNIPESIRGTYGDYTVVFKAFLKRSLPTNTEFILDPFDVATKMEYPSDEQLDTYDGILYTGSGKPVKALDPKHPTYPVLQLHRPTRTWNG